jgi:hypothetical protein
MSFPIFTKLEIFMSQILPSIAFAWWHLLSSLPNYSRSDFCLWSTDWNRHPHCSTLLYCYRPRSYYGPSTECTVWFNLSDSWLSYSNWRYSRKPQLMHGWTPSCPGWSPNLRSGEYSTWGQILCNSGFSRTAGSSAWCCSVSSNHFPDFGTQEGSRSCPLAAASEACSCWSWHQVGCFLKGHCIPSQFGGVSEFPDADVSIVGSRCCCCSSSYVHSGLLVRLAARAQIHSVYFKRDFLAMYSSILEPYY